MTEENHRKWDIIAKIVITPITLLLTLSWGIYQYNESRSDLIDKEQEVKIRDLIQKKETLYTETVNVVSSIANGDQGQPQLYNNSIKRFWELYWGGLASVESREVEGLMVKFGNTLKDSQNPEGGKTLSDLQQISLRIAHTTKQEIDSLYANATK